MASKRAPSAIAPDQPRPKRSTGPVRAAVSPPPSLDSLVHALAHGTAAAQAPPVWSAHTNLLAVPLPPAPQPAHAPLWADHEPFPATSATPTLAIQLTHLAGTGAASPRTSTRLDVPLPASFPAASARISLLSFSPDASQLVAVVTARGASGGGGVADDLVTVFEQRSSCVDDWACVLQESVGRFGGARSSAGGSSGVADAAGKKVMSLRWIGEPRRWYPSPTFPDAAREEAKKPLFCAPPRSAPVNGTAFVAVLSSEEILFIHMPNSSTAPSSSSTPAALPAIICLPLRPSPSSLAPSSPDSSATSKADLSLTAIPTPPTPLPLSALALLSAPLANGSVSASPPLASAAPVATANGTAGAVDTPTPQATIDALVSSLLPTLDPSGTASSSTAAAATPLVGGKTALQDELRLADAAASVLGTAFHGAAAAPLASGEVRGSRRRLMQAAIGACRSRGTAELGETVLVVASRVRVERGVRLDGAAVGSRRGSRVGLEQTKTEQEDKEEKKAGAAASRDEPLAVPSFDDELGMLADFTALDEAFGSGPSASSTADKAAAAPPADENKDVSADAEEERAELAAWAGVEAREACEGTNRDEGARERWRVELTEVRVEMVAMEGPRLTIRPQPPLYIDPTPASSASDDGAHSPSDPLLTHLTFLGDVSLPHPLQFTSQSPSLASDGSEPAVDLCLLAVVAHPHRAEPDAAPTWRSTLSSYALSKEEAYTLSDAFSALEGRKFDAPNAVEGESAWAARHAASADARGVLCAVEIRPGGGEWSSVMGVVAEPSTEGQGHEGEVPWKTRVHRLSSVTLEPLDKNEVGEMDEETTFLLPGSPLLHSLCVSPNGALLCGSPFSPSPSTQQPPRSLVIAASPLGRPNELSDRLATRFAIGLARQGDVSDLVGRVRGMSDAGTTLAVVQRTHEILRAMIPAEAMLDGTAMGMELLGVTTALFHGMPGLSKRGETAEKMLELAACARALKKADRQERGKAGGWKPDFDATWPLVGHCVWFCTHFLDDLVSSCFASSPNHAASLPSPVPALLLLLHPFFRTLLSVTTSHLLHLASYLSGPDSALSEALDLAKSVVEDAVQGALGGRGLAEWGKVVGKINSELDGGPAVASLSPPLLATLSIPPSLEAQATAIRSILASAFPDYAARAASQKQDGSTALPTPPRSPAPSDEWDIVRRARLSGVAPTPTSERQCLRCGRRTRALNAAAQALLAGAEVGRWKRFEDEWEGRCVCGGMWRRVIVA
ncbi:uncharacterized protein JCM10292_001291 [Rhodotorula paludigena]|uniref:uncharacterized protein n=1 Tax=Rhodotorula paludigena TaxID=86838 RepID=UPI0031813DD2